MGIMIFLELALFRVKYYYSLSYFKLKMTKNHPKTFDFLQMMNSVDVQQSLEQSSLKQNLEQQKEKHIKLMKSQYQDISEFIEQMYSSLHKKRMQLYGVNLYQQEDGSIVKVQLSKLQKMYLLKCFNIFNWESLTLQQLEEYIERLPENGWAVDAISLISGKIVMEMNGKIAVYPLTDKIFTIMEKCDFLSGCSINGYITSLTKVYFPHLQKSYQGRHLILETACSGNILAIRTAFDITMLNTDSMKSKKYEIKSLKIKWCSQRLMISCGDGFIRFIHKESALWNIMGEGIGMEDISSDRLDYNKEEFLININGEPIICSVGYQDIRFRRLGKINNILLNEIPGSEIIIFADGVYLEGSFRMLVITFESGRYKLYQIHIPYSF